MRKPAVQDRWLAGWKDHPGSEREALSEPNCPWATNMCLKHLTQGGFLVRISGKEGAYAVQCLRMRVGPYLAAPGVNLSYTGQGLNAVLQAALYEADLLERVLEQAATSVEERVRWVRSS